VSYLELTETQFKRTVRDKIAYKPIWCKKMTVLTTFLKLFINTLSNNLKKLFCTTREKSGIKISCLKHNIRNLELIYRSKFPGKVNLL